MNLTNKQIVELALHSANQTAPAEYSLENVNEALRDSFREMGGSLAMFHKNKYDIFEIITSVADEILPKRVDGLLGLFAETRFLKQGVTEEFQVRLGRNRAKKYFITAAGLSGVYETFRLDRKSYRVNVQAHGGATIVDFERLLDGSESIAEVMDVLVEGMVDIVVNLVHQALAAAVDHTSAPANNRVVSTVFEADKMARLVNVVKAYGGGAAIFATPEFIAEMGADAIVPGTANLPGVYSPDDIDAIHKTGLIKIFRGTPVIALPQTFVDTQNVETWLDPSIAYVLPTGGNKVVKIVVEGQTQMYDFTNRDNSWELHFYRKMGVAIEAYHNWGIYKNTGVADYYAPITTDPGQTDPGQTDPDPDPTNP